MRLSICAVLFLITTSAFGQFTIEGKVLTANEEPLVGASIFLRDSEYATISDETGYWKLQVSESGKYLLKCTYLGYNAIEKEIDLIDDYNFDLVMSGSIFELDKIEIKSSVAKESSPFTYSNFTKKDIQKNNLGQDMPVLLQHSTSAVMTSDAGAGIGYTGLRIRGSDATRINVTINGIPLNDAESQGVFWVNLPDFASSVSSLQIQRGVGTSTNGVGAFGATISMNTNEINQNPYANFNATYGSFNTLRYSAAVGTGLMNDKFSIDFRYSAIDSDGYIDRASSDLSSYFISAAKVGQKSMLRLNMFSGHEVTYQSWYGSPIQKVNGDDEGLLIHYNNNLGSIYQTTTDSLNLFGSDRRYNYYTYDNQVDDYTQTHYQLLYDRNLSNDWVVNSALHYTRGLGFFEEYKIDQSFADYNLPDQTNDDGMVFSSSDLIRRRWLDNHFMGGLTSLQKKFGESIFMTGAGFNTYIGDHYGQVAWAAVDSNIDNDDRYYDNRGNKTDFNAFAKLDYKLNDRLSIFGDVQLRNITYDIMGIDNDMVNLNIDTSMTFVNPKLGLNYQISNQQSIYASLAVANREPDRNDFVSNFVQSRTVMHETLYDYEAGWKMQTEKLSLQANAYFMDYKNQLVLTGELDDVGSNLRTNVPSSYRAGIELTAAISVLENLIWSPNFTLSRNKIKSFNQVVYDYTNGFEIINIPFENTDISFSPAVISGSSLRYRPIKNGEIEWLAKYVGKQYLDNTSDDAKSLDAYFVNDLRFSYDVDLAFAKSMRFSLLVNNVLNTLYSANGYTYSYIFGDTISEVFLYPQAGINFLLNAEIRF